MFPGVSRGTFFKNVPGAAFARPEIPPFQGSLYFPQNGISSFVSGGASSDGIASPAS